jgi:phage-related tail protein
LGDVANSIAILDFVGIRSFSILMDKLGGLFTKIARVALFVLVGSLQELSYLFFKIKNGAIGVFTKGLEFLRIAFTALGTAIKFIGTAISIIGRVMLSNPIILVITAIAALAILVIANWEKVKNFFANFFSGLVEKFQNVRDFFTNIFSSIAEKFQSVKTFFADVFNGITEKFQNFIKIGTFIKDFIKEVFDFLINTITDNPIFKIIEKGIGFVKNLIGGGDIKISNPINTVKEAVGLNSPVKPANNSQVYNINISSQGNPMEVAKEVSRELEKQQQLSMVGF